MEKGRRRMRNERKRMCEKKEKNTGKGASKKGRGKQTKEEDAKYKHGWIEKGKRKRDGRKRMSVNEGKRKQME